MGHDSQPSLGMASRGTPPSCDGHCYMTTAPHPPQCRSPDVTSESFSTQWSRQLQPIAWSQNQRRKRLIRITALFQSSHTTNTKTEGSEGKKVVCPRSYSKTVGKLGLLCTHKASSPSITREETQLTWNITRTWKNFKISPWSWKVCLYIQWNMQGSSYHPSKETTWAFWGQRKQYANSWVKGGGGEWYLTMQEFLNCFSNKTNHWLFIS